MSTTLEDDTFPADPDLDVRPDPAKLRGYWGDPADRPPRPLWDPSGVDASPLDEPHGPPARPARQAPERIRPLDVRPSPAETRSDVTEASLEDHVRAILLAGFSGVIAVGASALFLLSPGTFRGEASATWFMAPEPLKLAIALVLMGSAYLFLGIAVGKAAPRAWGWSILVAWGPTVLLLLNIFAILPHDLAVFERLPDFSRRLLGMGGAPILLLALALLGGFLGSRTGSGSSREAGDPGEEVTSDRLPIGRGGQL